jgi:hypothetical protein
MSANHHPSTADRCTQQQQQQQQRSAVFLPV